MKRQVDLEPLRPLLEFCAQRHGAVCVFAETDDLGQTGYTVQANADGPRRDSFEYLEAEIAGDDIAGCAREVLDELRAQEAADAP